MTDRHIVTVPHEALLALLPASALAETASALTAPTASAAATQRRDHLLGDIRPSLAVDCCRNADDVRCSLFTDVTVTLLVGWPGRRA